VNIEKLNVALEDLQTAMRGGLISSSIWGSDGLDLRKFNDTPVTAAMFEQFYQFFDGALKTVGWPSLEPYYMMQLEDNTWAVLLVSDSLRWSLIVDRDKVTLGMLMSVILPKAVADLNAIAA
jgi:hypothetical protein